MNTNIFHLISVIKIVFVEKKNKKKVTKTQKQVLIDRSPFQYNVFKLFIFINC
jgi:hypothetical protein